jgi:hypothetical protein
MEFFELELSDNFVCRYWDNVEVKTKEECWIWEGRKNSKGYGTIGYKKKRILATRTSYYYHYGKFENKLFVCHRCDNPICVNPHHLFLGNQKDNIQDMLAKGRNNPLKGSKQASSKLNEEKVSQIRSLYLNTEITEKELAIKFGVSETAIADVITNKTWKHVFGEKIIKHRGKYSTEEIKEIRELFAKKINYKEIMKKFDINNPNTFYAIINKVIYAWVE